MYRRQGIASFFVVALRHEVLEVNNGVNPVVWVVSWLPEAPETGIKRTMPRKPRIQYPGAM